MPTFWMYRRKSCLATSQRTLARKAPAGSHDKETMKDETRGAEERRQEEHEHRRAEQSRRGSGLDDAEQDPGELRLIDGKLLGQLAHHVTRRQFSRQHESDHGDAEEQDGDQAHEEEEREAGAHEEAVGGDEARERAAGARGHNCRKKCARSPPFTSNRRTLLSRITSRVSASPGS